MPDENSKENQEEVKPSITPLLDQSNAVAERLEKAAQAARAENDRLEKLLSEQKLSGTAGIRPPMPETKPETPSEYRRRIEAELRTGKFNASQ